MKLHIDGFDHFANSSRLRDYLSGAGYKMDRLPQPSIVSGRGDPRISRALSLNSGELRRDAPWTGNKFSFGCALEMGDRGSVMGIRFGLDHTDPIVLWFHPDDGQPRLNDQTGGSLPVRWRYYYYEIELNRLAATATLYINNRMELVLPLNETQTSAATLEVTFGSMAEVFQFRPGDSASERFGRIYDDTYIRDGERLGPIVVTTRFPTTEELMEWVVWGPPNATSVDILSAVPPQELDQYISTEYGSKMCRFSSGDALKSPYDVLATGLVALARKAPDANLTLRGFIGGNGNVQYRSQDVSPVNAWRYYYMTFDRVATDTKDNIKQASFGFQTL